MVQKEDIINENFIALQSVLANLTEKLDKLTKQISLLLSLFEKTAVKFNETNSNANSSTNIMSGDDKELINKLDRVSEENKTIAKALALLGQKVRNY